MRVSLFQSDIEDLTPIKYPMHDFFNQILQTWRLQSNSECLTHPIKYRKWDSPDLIVQTWLLRLDSTDSTLLIWWRILHSSDQITKA